MPMPMTSYFALKTARSKAPQLAVVAACAMGCPIRNITLRVPKKWRLCLPIFLRPSPRPKKSWIKLSRSRYFAMCCYPSLTFQMILSIQQTMRMVVSGVKMPIWGIWPWTGQRVAMGNWPMKLKSAWILNFLSLKIPVTQAIFWSYKTLSQRPEKWESQ